MANVLDLAVEEEREAAQEIGAVVRGLRRIHTRESNFGNRIDGGKDVAFHATPVDDDRIEAKEESGDLLFAELDDTLLFQGRLALPLGSGNLGGAVIDAVFLDYLLDFPSRNMLMVQSVIQVGNLLFPVVEVSPAKCDDPLLLQRCDHPLPLPDRHGRLRFERDQGVGIEPLLPRIEGLAGDAEMAAGFGDIFVFAVIIEPGKATLGLRGKRRGNGRPAVEGEPAGAGSPHVARTHE